MSSYYFPPRVPPEKLRKKKGSADINDEDLKDDPRLKIRSIRNNLAIKNSCWLRKEEWFPMLEVNLVAGIYFADRVDLFRKSWAKQLLRNSRKEGIITVDLLPSRRVEDYDVIVIGVGDGRVYIYRTNDNWNSIPDSIARILADKNVIKVGHEMSKYPERSNNRIPLPNSRVELTHIVDANKRILKIPDLDTDLIFRVSMGLYELSIGPFRDKKHYENIYGRWHYGFSDRGIKPRNPRTWDNLYTWRKVPELFQAVHFATRVRLPWILMEQVVAKKTMDQLSTDHGDLDDMRLDEVEHYVINEATDDDTVKNNLKNYIYPIYVTVVFVIFYVYF